jgi:nucleoid-associated protein YgaU
MAERVKLAKERAELEKLRRQYEAELAAQAQTHADKPDWTHTVVPGDTLSGIAKKYYGKAARWPEIYEANKGIIKDPNLIYPGQVFVIPDDAD